MSIMQKKYAKFRKIALNGIRKTAQSIQYICNIDQYCPSFKGKAKNFKRNQGIGHYLKTLRVIAKAFYAVRIIAQVFEAMRKIAKAFEGSAKIRKG